MSKTEEQLKKELGELSDELQDRVEVVGEVEREYFHGRHRSDYEMLRVVLHNQRVIMKTLKAFIAHGDV